MRTELGDDQWLELDQGRLTGPGGRVYQRRGTRAKRRRCEEAVAAGVPLVLRYWAGGQLDWYDGDDALARWQEVRRSVVQTPRLRGDVEWTAGMWEDGDGQPLLVLEGHC